MISPFSKRHSKAIASGKIFVSVSLTLRKRIWLILKDFDRNIDRDRNLHQYPPPSFKDLATELGKIYGDYDLTAAKVDIFIEDTAPCKVLDVIEVYFSICDLHSEPSSLLQRNLNTAFSDEDCPWRLVDGQFMKIDSEFLEEISARVMEMMNSEGFEGALDEFQRARNELSREESRSAIRSAGDSIESVMKAIVGKHTGKAQDLILELSKAGYFDDLPEHIRKAFTKQVMNALPVMRNEMGGHGQGQDKIVIPEDYARLAIHLCAVFNLFLITKYCNLNNRKSPQQEDYDIPF